MAKVAISFIGLGKCCETTYVMGEKEFHTSLFGEVVWDWFRPDSYFVMATPQAKISENMALMTERLGGKFTIVDIPDGKTYDELWEIFDSCVSCISEGDSVVLDVTHAFRSIPLTVFTAAVFLKRIKNVQIESIIYGSYQGRDQANRSPVYDLSTMVELMEWLEGLDAFSRRADAGELARLLNNAYLKPSQTGTMDYKKLPTGLRTAAKYLDKLSRALHLSRPMEVMEYSSSLINILDGISKEERKWASPFFVVLDKIKKEIEPLAYHEPKVLCKENLYAQLSLVKYYLDKALFVQAITLMREWVVSCLALNMGIDGWLMRKNRKEVEEALNTGAAEQYLSNINNIWGITHSLRNDIAHSGINDKPAKPNGISKRAFELYEELVKLQSLAPDTSLKVQRL